MFSSSTASGSKLLGRILRTFGFVIFGALLLSPQLFAHSASLGQSVTPSGSYSTSGFSLCSSGTRSFRVSYQHDFDPGGVVGFNPYRMTARLFKDGNLIGTSTFEGSSAWSNQHFYNLSVVPGTYSATVQLDKFTWLGWETVGTVSTNSVTASTNASPDFTVNGISIPSNGTPINVCASYIKVDASATSCETSYWVGVHERDLWWNRTYQQEFGSWFSGQAPNNISLQQLAVSSPNWNGAANRKGSILFCGYLDSPTNSVERYYMVEVCTLEPSWLCKYALIKLDCSC